MQLHMGTPPSNYIAMLVGLTGAKTQFVRKWAKPRKTVAGWGQGRNPTSGNINQKSLCAPPWKKGVGIGEYERPLASWGIHFKMGGVIQGDERHRSRGGARRQGPSNLGAWIRSEERGVPSRERRTSHIMKKKDPVRKDTGKRGRLVGGGGRISNGGLAALRLNRQKSR